MPGVRASRACSKPSRTFFCPAADTTTAIAAVNRGRGRSHGHNPSKSKSCTQVKACAQLKPCTRAKPCIQVKPCIQINQVRSWWMQVMPWIPARDSQWPDQLLSPTYPLSTAEPCFHRQQRSILHFRLPWDEILPYSRVLSRIRSILRHPSSARSPRPAFRPRKHYSRIIAAMQQSRQKADSWHVNNWHVPETSEHHAHPPPKGWLSQSLACDMPLDSDCQ